MKKIFIVLAAITLTASVFTQTPKTMSYQAVIRNSINVLVVNQVVSMRISILQNSADGTAVYTETQNVSTNDNGLVSIEIGLGANFAKINWATGPYFIKTETDPTGGTNYTITGTSQLLTVPYAKYAEIAGNVKMQTLSIASRTISLSDANKIILPDSVSYAKVAGNVKLQTLSIASRTISLSDANNITLPDSVSFASKSKNAYTFHKVELKGITLCNSDNEGIMRYDNNAKTMEYCNGNSWVAIGGNFSVGLPQIITTAISSITSNNAFSGGTISTNGGSEIIQKGICWYTASSPTINNFKTLNGTSSESFITEAGGLVSNQTFYIRAYATNFAGTSYGNEQIFTSLAVVMTNTASSLTTISFITGGEIVTGGNAEITERGIVYSLSTNPTIADSKINLGSGTGSFTTEISGLTANKTYYYRAYAINAGGVSYSSTMVIATLLNLNSIDATTSTTTSFTAGGDIESGGNAVITSRGIVYGTSTNPTILGTKTNNGIGAGSFVSTATGLVNNTKYYYRAYAINAGGTTYSIEKSATTLAVLTTNTAVSVTTTSFITGGTVLVGGGAEIIEQGIVYSLVTNPTIADSKVTSEISTGSFTTQITGLSSNKTYYYRAYVINAGGVSYSSTMITATLPEIIAVDATTTTSTSFKAGGNIEIGGDAAISSRGIVYGTSTNPTILGTKTNNGIGAGTFVSTVTGLANNTKYYYRAYATNIGGTNFSIQKTATTLAEVTTNTAASVTSTSFTTGGYVYNGGNAEIIERGIVYSLSATPTIDDNKVISGIGSGDFIIEITALVTNKTYYYRAYATNAGGTVYGETKVESLHTMGTTQADADGNIYNSVKIGSQVWMTENLKTSKLNDNTLITNITTAASWTVLTTPAYCWYDNQATATTTYGALYNWYTVATNKLCPTGWHVPTDAEWSTLIDYLGGLSEAGGKLKETGTTNWKNNNIGASNESNFLALPGGYISASGDFVDIGYNGSWWINSEYKYDSTYSYICKLSTFNKEANKTISKKVSGVSVRCIRD